MTENNVTVTYTINSEAKAEHVRLINEIFRELSDKAIADVDYKVTCLEDGVTFVHVARITTIDGSNPLTSLSSFNEFSNTLPGRAATMPVVTDSDLIGYYHGIA